MRFLDLNYIGASRYGFYCIVINFFALNWFEIEKKKFKNFDF